MTKNSTQIVYQISVHNHASDKNKAFPPQLWSNMPTLACCCLVVVTVSKCNQLGPHWLTGLSSYNAIVKPPLLLIEE